MRAKKQARPRWVYEPAVSSGSPYWDNLAVTSAVTSAEVTTEQLEASEIAAAEQLEASEIAAVTSAVTLSELWQARIATLVSMLGTTPVFLALNMTRNLNRYRYPNP